MISILIPIYNFNGIKLVTDLHRQGFNLGVPFEIIVADDHSPNPVEAHEQINELAYAKYVYLPRNMGRAGSRNWLAQKAQFPFLLFIDGDMGVDNPNFLKNYLEVLADNRVVCGGHFYASQRPEPKYRLHWIYGRNREVRPAAERNKSPFGGFMPSNFVIPKPVFDAIRFDDSIKGYGHEDTLFGEMLKKLKMEGGQPELLHVDNGLVHLGLSTNEEFMDKVDTAVKNLVFLEKKYPYKLTTLQQTAAKFKFLSPFFRSVPSPFLRKRIISGHNLRLLDLYKLVRYFENVKA